MEFSSRYGPWALIAGVSEGVGASVARLLGERGINLVLVGRRQPGLGAVAATVSSETRTLVLDLNDADAARRMADAAADLEVGLVVYNAGAAGCVPPIPYLSQPFEYWRDIISRNGVAVAEVAHHFGGPMVARGRGGIVLVGSTAAWAGTANMAIYCATKAFQRGLAESLWAEFRPAGVDVLAMILGPTDTPAFQRILNGVRVEGLADCDVVAREMLGGLAEGPIWPPGPEPSGALPRRDAVLNRGGQRDALFASDGVRII
jgi:short-subunit dehydrogenase